MSEFKAFTGARFKVERAKGLFNDLREELLNYLDSDFYRMEIKADPLSQANRLEFESRTAVPDLIPLIVGDVIHNTRTALDLLTAQMFREKTGASPRRVKFPFSDTAVGVRAAFTNPKGDLQHVGTKVLDYVVNEVRPHKGPNGDALLYALNDLDIEDKHHLIVPIVSVPRLSGVVVIDDRQNRFTFDVPIENGNLITAVDSDAPLRFESQGRPSFHVAFPVGMPLENHAVLNTLKDFITLVSNIIDGAERL